MQVEKMEDMEEIAVWTKKSVSHPTGGWFAEVY